jgi:hypothetical protein
LVQVTSVAGNRIAQIILLLGATALPFGGVYLWYAGSAVVIDETGHVESAVVTDGRSEQPLRHLWNGYFFAIPEIEGTIEVRCRDGVRKRMGYVTGHIDTKIKVSGKSPCANVVRVP